MRDILLIVIVLGSIPFILRRPHVGVLMWVWLSVMNPHRLTWGMAYYLPFAAVVAAVTLIAVVFTRDKKPPPLNGLTVTLLLFVGWTGITTFFAFFPAESFQTWKTMLKTQLMVLLIPMLFHNKEHLRLLIWITALSVAYYGIKGGVFVLLTGGAYKIWGPLYTYIEDNNSLAVALVAIIPLLRYLQLTSPVKHVRWALIGMMGLCGLSVLGTHSRGALVAVATMGAYLMWKTHKRAQLVLLGMIAIPFVLAFMPDHWYARMDTIVNYEQDASGSASMRLNTWSTMFNLAKDNPIVGGGFEVAMPEIYNRYAPDRSFPPQVAHSIYFQAMGEHGFVGFGLYMLLLWLFWRQAGALARMTKGRADLAWAHNFGLMMQVSLVGFCAGGAFLSLILYDVPYYLLAALVATRVIVEKELRKASVASTHPLPLAGMGAQQTPSPRSG